jgi:hypothetical protein
MNLHDTLTELWRLAESGDITQETRLESSAMLFQDMLFNYNDAMGENAMNEFIGPPELEKPIGNFIDMPAYERDKWTPFTFEEIDAIRHYYGQKMALENEGTIMGLAVPLAHELAEPESGLFSPNRGESLYDLYVNAIAAKDYYTDKGLPGTPFGQMLQDGNVTEEEFTFWGDEALKRVPVFEVPEEKR